MASRSENNAVGNTKFTDLNMTFYPAKVDNKIEGQNGYNPNLKGFWSAGDNNLPAGTDPDFNMAEHVNSLADAVIAIQRILGINPHVDSTGGNGAGTVSTRIAAAENKDAYYDKRYGGESWSTGLGQTILTHTHGGGQNQAPKINLAGEVSGTLAKANINLSQATGITGEDLYMSGAVSTRISDAVNDKLSTSQGGTIGKGLNVQGAFGNRTYREWSAATVTTGAAITDNKTLENVARRYTGTSQQNIIQEAVPNLLCGKYVLGVRVRTSSLSSADVLSFSFLEYSQSLKGWSVGGVTNIKGTDFNKANEWQTFYLVFDHETHDSTGHNSLRIARDSSGSSLNIDFDCAWIMPVHPAVFDK